MYFSVWVVLALGLVLWAIDALLIWLGGRNFRRDRLMTRI
jgi:hypothetical protein